MVKVKICGITNIQDAQAAVKAGADALGFVFYPKSPRYVLPEEAKLIIRCLPARVEKVGVFVNARENTIRAIKKYCGLTMLQFHGNESPDFCRKFSRERVIKALRVQGSGDVTRVSRFATYGALFDSFEPGVPGGTGKSFDWSLATESAAGRKIVFISGGLTPRNVAEAVRRFRPDWVDVSTGVEMAPGKKDAAKLAAFVRAAKGRI